MGSAVEAWYHLTYHCYGCNITWEDEWSCACDDECPKCGVPHTPESAVDAVTGEVYE